jgi:hypothetical protein
MSHSSTISKLSASTALVTVGDFEGWVKRRQALIQKRGDFKIERAELDHREAANEQEIAKLDKDIEFFEPFIRRAASSVIKEQEEQANEGEPSVQRQLASPAPATPPTEKVDGRTLRSKVSQTGVDAMREIVVELGRKNPKGFTTKQVFDTGRNDERFSSALKHASDGYRHALMKRFVEERLIVRVDFGKYVLLENLGNAEMINEGAVMYTDEGYKVVPMTKAERVRHEIKKFLMFRPGKTSHRLQIAEKLAELGVLDGDKNLLPTLAQYLIKWPEFVSDGKGNYTYEPDKFQELNEALGKGSGQPGGGSPTGP